MAEFKEVIKHWDRLGSKGCDNCPIEDLCDDLMEQTNGIRSICDCLIENADKIEDGVMAWAAEHPEPVYPTLIEYLRGLGLEHHRMCDPIPTDVARKLGLKPKEVEK